MYIPKPLEDKITLPHLKKLKQQGEKFACLTAYDYSFAKLVEASGAVRYKTYRVYEKPLA